MNDVWQLLLFLINEFPNDCQWYVVHKIEVWPVGRPRLVWTCWSLVLRSSRLARAWCAVESKSRQQLDTDRCLAATVWAARHHSNMHHSLCCMKTTPVHQRLETPTRSNTFIINQWRTSMSWSSIRLKRPWSATSRASLIKRLISDKIVLLRVSKPKSNTEHLL